MKENRNFYSYLWHALWLSLAETFAERNTVLPGLILLAGGSEPDIGMLTAIMIGIPLISQLFFASYLTSKEYKKPFLLIGIYIRIASFFGLAASIYLIRDLSASQFIAIIFFWMVLFSISGAFAGVSYTDIIGKSFTSETRKRFFVTKQIITSIGILISAFLVKDLLVSIDYPENYGAAFTIAGILLFIASLGFIFLKEKRSEIKKQYSSIREVIKSVPAEIRANPNLKYFVIISNLIGTTFTLIPFYIAYSRTVFEITEDLIGQFLLAQLSGMVISNLIWKRFLKKYSFKGMLKVTSVMMGIAPLLVIIISSFNSVVLFAGVFLLIGSGISSQKITMEGVLIEISNEANRPLYIGIYGTLNLTSAFLPLLSGSLFGIIGYHYIFILWSFLTFSSLFLIKKMVCPVGIEEKKSI